jgi:hypothetical protein
MSAIKNISLFIPHVYGNYTSSMVSDVFDEMSFGRVKNVDFIHKMGTDGKAYNAAYIHFYEWYDNTVARNFQEPGLDPKREARVMYDDPWYWIVLENKGKKHVPGQRKPRIDLDAFNTPENSIAPSLSQRQPGAPVKMKSWAQVVHPPTPVNLENAFNAEAQAAGCEVTQEEMDWAYDQMENEEMMAEIENEMDIDDFHLATFDSRYVQSLEQENEMLRSQVAYFQNLYYTETIKTQTLMDTIASTGYKA